MVGIVRVGTPHLHFHIEQGSVIGAVDTLGQAPPLPCGFWWTFQNVSPIAPGFPRQLLESIRKQDLCPSLL